MSMEIVLALFEYLVLVLSISIHDAAEAWTASRLGDPTARMLGRISLNPLRHYDLWGTVLWPLVFLFRSPLVIGWGKDVPVTERNLRKPSQVNFVHLSGPAAQLLAATVCLIILVVLKHVSPAAAGSLLLVPLYAMRAPVVPSESLPALFPVILLLYLGILVNILLFAFNLMPLPTLDGGKILRYYLPYNAARLYDEYSFYITIGFLFLGFRLIYLIFGPLLGIYQSLLASLEPQARARFRTVRSIRWLSAAAPPSRCAARLKRAGSATARKYRRCLNSISASILQAINHHLSAIGHLTSRLLP